MSYFVIKQKHFWITFGLFAKESQFFKKPSKKNIYKLIKKYGSTALETFGSIVKDICSSIWIRRK